MSFSVIRRPSFLKALILLPAVLRMASALFAPIHGNFYFRQAHVVANIEKFLSSGLSLRPATYNADVPFALFDFPAYQLFVASLCRSLGSDPLVTARFVSVACFVLSFLVVDALLVETGVEPLAALLTLVFFSYAPLNLFYFESPMVDAMAILFSVLSLYGFILWEKSPGGGRRWGYFFAMTLAGVLATLIKNPVYLPVAVAIGAHTLVRRGARSVLEPAFLAFAGTIGCAVVSFKIYSNAVNGIPEGFWGQTEVADYFGPLGDRLDPRSWDRVLGIMATQILSPMSVGLLLIGLLWYAFRSKGEYKSLFLGLFGGAVVTLLVFFARFTWHNYYQLPLVLPLAFFAAEGVRVLAAPRRLAPALVALVVLVSVTYANARYGEMSSTPTEWIRANGEWISEHTEPADFVVYLIDSDDGRDWNAVFLYFAKRDGYNLTRARLGRRPEVLRSLYHQYASGYRRFLIFCPRDLYRALSPKLESQGARPIEAGSRGILFELRGPEVFAHVSE